MKEYIKCQYCGKFQLSEKLWGHYYPRRLIKESEISHAPCPGCKKNIKQ